MTIYDLWYDAMVSVHHHIYVFEYHGQLFWTDSHVLARVPKEALKDVEADHTYLVSQGKVVQVPASQTMPTGIRKMTPAGAAKKLEEWEGSQRIRMLKATELISDHPDDIEHKPMEVQGRVQDVMVLPLDNTTKTLNVNSKAWTVLRSTVARGGTLHTGRSTSLIVVKTSNIMAAVGVILSVS